MVTLPPRISMFPSSASLSFEETRPPAPDSMDRTPPSTVTLSLPTTPFFAALTDTVPSLILRSSFVTTPCPLSQEMLTAPSPFRFRSHRAKTAASASSSSEKAPTEARLLTLPAAEARMSLSALRARMAAEPDFVTSAPSRISLTFALPGAFTTICPSESVPRRR